MTIIHTDIYGVEVVRVVPKYALVVFSGCTTHAGSAYQVSSGLINRFHMQLESQEFQVSANPDQFSLHAEPLKTSRDTNKHQAAEKARSKKAALADIRKIAKVKQLRQLMENKSKSLTLKNC